MTTPERPSLADTLAHIDAALAERAPGSGPTIAEVNTARERLGLPQLEVHGPCLRCARQALRGSEFCAAHKRIPREMIEELGPVEPVVRDGNTFTVTQPGVYQFGGVVHPYAKAAAPAPPHLPGPPGPTCPGCAARDARPGWLARSRSPRAAQPKGTRHDWTES